MSADANTDATSGAGVEGRDDMPLCVRDLDTGYDDLQILTDVDTDVFDGECVAIIGPNRAGKSTAMKSVFGLTAHMGGTIRFKDGDTTGCRSEDIIHVGIGYVPQNGNIFPTLTVGENLGVDAYILNEAPQDVMGAVYGWFPILREWKDQKAGTMSGGQQQMLAMSRVFMLDPDLLPLDEPSAGLVPDLVGGMFDKTDGISGADTAVLMVGQSAKEALRHCDRGYVLANGQNRYMDTDITLLGNEQIRQDFLGGQPVSTVRALFG